MGSFADGFEKRGAADFLLMQLRTKFKRVPKQRQQQIRDASVEQIIAWGKRLVFETSIDAVFEG